MACNCKKSGSAKQALSRQPAKKVERNVEENSNQTSSTRRFIIKRPVRWGHPLQ